MKGVKIILRSKGGGGGGKNVVLYRYTEESGGVACEREI